MSMLTRHFYQFGPFRIDAEKRLLTREGEAVPLKPKTFDMLLALVQHHGQVLEKDDLMGMLWPDSDVEESNLPLHISALRKALGESPNERGYIVTVPGRGYRFVADVEELDNEGQDLIVERYTQSSILIEEHIASPDDAIRALPAPRVFSDRFKRVLAGLCILAITSLLAGLWLGLSKKTERQPGNLLIQSLAVLPFRELGAGSAEYMGIGIADSLITRLSNLREIKVRPTSAVLKYGNEPKQPADSGRELGVEAVLEGSIHRDGENVRVTVQLVRVADGSTLWAEKFDDRFTGIFKIEDSISRQVAERLVPKLTGKEREVVAKHYTENTEAYQLYLKGRYHWNKWTPEGWQKSIEYFQQAIEKDPGYALAYVGVSNAYNALGFFDVMLPREARPKAEEAAVKALEIDDTLGEAHAALGTVKYSYAWDWAAAERELRRAIELNPNDEVAHTVYAFYLHSMGRADEGLVEMKRAYELNPLSIRINAGLGDMLAFAHAHGQYDQAIEQYRKTIELEPAQWSLAGIYFRLGAVYEKKGMYEEAIAEYQKGMNLSGDSDLAAAFEQAYKTSGFREARRVVTKIGLEKMIKDSKGERVPPLRFAFIYADLGEKEQALEWLEKAYQEHSCGLVHLGDGIACTCDALRSDPRFAGLLRRIGLPPP